MGEPDVEVFEQRQRVEVTNALKRAIGQCEAGDFQQAQTLLTDTKVQVQQRMAASKRPLPMAEALCAELDDAQVRMSSSSAFRLGGQAEMNDALMMHQFERCTNTYQSSMGIQKASKSMYIQPQQM